ncbi:MAG: hypothetical protein K6F14_06950 [Clostridiales bacterium]|nr:hypothetical protein [Clostridiales bacterium]
MRRTERNKSRSVLFAWKAPLFCKLIMVGLLCSVLVATTFAWLGINNQADTNDVKMRVNVSPNLVISDNSSAIAGYTASSLSNSYIEKRWSEDAKELIPVDHYDSDDYPTVTGTNVFNLVYNTNPENVSRITGKGDDLTFAHVPSQSANKYFIDKVVYIASLDKAMTKNSDYSVITFTITENGSGTTTNEAYKSASVDIYVSGTYKGTLNLDDLDHFSINDINSIPLNTIGSIQITLRCYFDGALQKNNTTNYVNSSSLATNTADISFDISIEAN